MARRRDHGCVAGDDCCIRPRRSAGELSQPPGPHRDYSAGSVVFGRIVAQNMATQWNGSIILESKSGANGSIAAEEVARATPDGYTWLLVTVFFTASPSLYANLRWNPIRDFIPVGQICRAPNFFIVPTLLPVKNVAGYVAMAKEKPGMLNYGHPGKGSTGHLGFELFKRLAGIDVTAVGYRGYPEMVADIATGRLNSTFLSANQALAQVQTGAIRIIGTINDGRTKYFPDVPTMAEQGFPEAQVTPWFGIVVPHGYTAANRRSYQQGAGGGTRGAGGEAEARYCRLRTEERAAWRNSPISSRPMLRYGRRSSRTPASRRTEAGTANRPAGHVPLGADSGVYRKIAGSRSRPCLLPHSSNGYGRFRCRSAN